MIAYVVGGVALAIWLAGFIVAERTTWVAQDEPWYGKLFAHLFLFFLWPFVALYMASEG